MATIEEIRSQYPQYKDLSDQALATALHAKYYSDMPLADFSQRIGLKGPATSKVGAYAKAALEGGTFGLASTMAAGAELDLPPSTLGGYDFNKEKGKVQASIDASRKDYPDVFRSVEPIAGATVSSLALAPAGIGSLLARIGIAGLGGGAGSGINEAATPGSTAGSVAREATLGGLTMGGAELGGAALAGLASKVIAPGVSIPYITPMRDAVQSWMGKVPGMARDASDAVVNAMPEGPMRAGVAKGVDVFGSVARTVGNMASSPLMTNAVMPITTAVAGPMVSVPIAVLRELMKPGALSRYLARKPLDPATDEAMRQAVTLGMRQQAAP